MLNLSMILSLLLLVVHLAYGQTQKGEPINGLAERNLFGSSVAISSDGNVIAVGAPKYSLETTGDLEGMVRVYEWNETEWIQVGNDLIGNEGQADYFGTSVSLSSDGKTVAAGAVQNLGFGLSGNGYTRIYRRENENWLQLGQDIEGELFEDESGTSVSLSSDGNTIAIGSPLNPSGTFTGQVRIYRWEDGNWNQLGTDIEGEAAGDHFGRRVSLSGNGNIVAVGAPRNDGNGDFSGHVRVYEWDGAIWSQMGMDIDGEEGGEAFGSDGSGSAVALSRDGNTIAIGAPGNDGNGDQSGHVRIYQWNGSSWSQLGKDIDGEAILDQSGSSVSISADGTILAIGAIFNDAGSTDNTNVGHVRIYQWNGSNWNQIGDDMESGNEVGGAFGFSVALSSDGNTLIIGAPDIDLNGSQSGQIRVYELSNVTSLSEKNRFPAKLYPNPTSRFLNLDISERLEQVRVYDLSGNLVKLIKPTSSNLNVAELESGIYIVELVARDYIKIGRIVKM